MTDRAAMPSTGSAISKEIFLHKMAARRGYRLYQWPTGSYCLVSIKTRDLAGPGVNLTLDEVAQHLLCIPELEKAQP